MAKKQWVGETWKGVAMNGKVRKGKGRWWQFERSDGRKFIMTEVQSFVEEKKEEKRELAFK